MTKKVNGAGLAPDIKALEGMLSSLDKGALASLAQRLQEKAARAFLEKPEAVITQFPIYAKDDRGKRVLDKDGKPIVDRMVPGILIKTARTTKAGKLSQTELRIYSVALARAVLDPDVQQTCAEFVAQNDKA